jgi:hypothetical protein
VKNKNKIIKIKIKIEQEDVRSPKVLWYSTLSKEGLGSLVEGNEYF